MIFVHSITLDQIESIKLDWKKADRVARIQKAFNNKNEFFAAFTDILQNNGKCVSICAFEPGNISYLDGFVTLQKAIETKYKKCWLMASPNYNEKTDTYIEAKGLNAKYREQNFLKEINLNSTENCWKCPVSLFSTKNISDSEVKKLFNKKFG